MSADRRIEDTIEPAEIAVLALGRLRQGVRARPLATLAVVFGAGFVLGRGLPSVVVRLGSAFALRAVAHRVMTEMRAGVVSGPREGSGGTTYGDRFGADA